MPGMSAEQAIALYGGHVKDEDALQKGKDSGTAIGDAAQVNGRSAPLSSDFKSPPRVKSSIVFDEFHAQSYSCLVCERRPITAAHLLGKGGRRGDDVEANLIPLCGSGSHGCHGAYDNGHSYYNQYGEKITPEYVKQQVGHWLLSEDGEDARWYVTQKLGLGGSQEFLRSLGVDPDDQEPPEATKDPRPDPRTHPEFWTE